VAVVVGAEKWAPGGHYCSISPWSVESCLAEAPARAPCSCASPAAFFRAIIARFLYLLQAVVVVLARPSGFSRAIISMMTARTRPAISSIAAQLTACNPYQVVDQRELKSL
jgi:hypothetical protein